MLIDTHIHLDAHELAADLAGILQRAQAQGVGGYVIPAVHPENWESVRALAHQLPNAAYALGIHPLYVERAQEADLKRLDEALTRYQTDPKLVAVGEIGLDFFVEHLAQGSLREWQEMFFHEQLRIAKRHQLPVIMHVRRSQDVQLKHMRQVGVLGGIAHAFNGSTEQAKRFIEFGCALGFGGAMTYDGSERIRKLASTLPADAIVLETDSPDIPPQWLRMQSPQGQLLPNVPEQLPRIAQVLAQLRQQTYENVIECTARNAIRVLPRLQAALQPAG